MKIYESRRNINQMVQVMENIPYDSLMQPEISTKNGLMNNENDRSKLLNGLELGTTPNNI